MVTGARLLPMLLMIVEQLVKLQTFTCAAVAHQGRQPPVDENTLQTWARQHRGGCFGQGPCIGRPDQGIVSNRQLPWGH